MDAQTICQLLVMLGLVINFFGTTYTDFHGRNGSAAYGFKGFVITCIIIAIVAAIQYGAGSFSKLM